MRFEIERQLLMKANCQQVAIKTVFDSLGCKVPSSDRRKESSQPFLLLA